MSNYNDLTCLHPFQSTYIVLFHAVKDGMIQSGQIDSMRRHTRERSLSYVELLADGRITLHEHVVDIPKFLDICNNHTKYILVF